MSVTQAFGPRELRDVLGTFVTGVTVVTTCDAAGVGYGVTANSFSSVSLDPPLVLWSQSLSSQSYPAFQASEFFAVNILADHQVGISNHFAKSGPDKFNGIEHSLGLGGVPVLKDLAAHLECRKVAEYPGGDHVVYIGRVERIGHSARPPLAFGSGKYMVAYAHDLGPTALHLGTSKAAHLEGTRLAIAAMPRIARELGEHTLGLSVWGNHGPTAIHWEPSQKPVSDQLRVGFVMSIVRSATGRAFAAFLPSQMTEPFVAEDLRYARLPMGGLQPGRESFDAEVRVARERGLSRAVGAEPSRLHQVAVNAFSVPIFDEAGDMVMALSLTTPASRLDPDYDGAIPQGLKAAAQEISQQLGHAVQGSRAYG